METFERLRAETPAEEPVYVLHELVHNRVVTGQMESRGAVFIATPEELPEGATCLIGAHGVGAETERLLRKRTGHLVDATCPIVAKVQQSAAKLTAEEALVLFGVRGHPEAVGILGHAGTARHFLVTGAEEIAALPELSRPVLLCQTTMSHEQADSVFAALRARFPDARRDGNRLARRHRETSLRLPRQHLRARANLFLSSRRYRKDGQAPAPLRTDDRGQGVEPPCVSGPVVG